MLIKVHDSALRLRTSVRFYELFAPISKAMAARVFREVHASQDSGDTVITRRELTARGSPAIADYTIFSYNKEPSFLEGSGLSEYRYGLIVLVQYRDRACVSTMGGATFPDTAIATVARRLAAEAVTDVEGEDKIQGYSSRSMSTSRGGIRARTLAGDDIGARIASLTRSREILTAVRTTRGGAARTARPSTAHVAASLPRATLQELVDWVAAEIDAVHTRTARPAGERSAFVQSFARYIKREDLPGGVQPNAVFVDLATLEEGIAEGSLAVFLQGPRGAPPTAVPDALALAAIRLFGEPGTVDAHTLAATKAAVRFDGVVHPFELHMNKQTYSLSSPFLKAVRIGDPQGSSLRTLPAWLSDPDHEALFVSMNDIRFAFAQGRIVRDEHILALAPSLLTCLQAVPALAACVSEKGEAALTATSTTFPAASVFEAIEGQIAREPALVCDDLGDEWADYIGIDAQTKSVTLYHAKHGELTSGASAFQTVVGQAVKNLGRIGVIRRDLDGKTDGWGEPYRLDKITTAISRVRRGGTVDDVARAYEEVAVSPGRRARVALVLSFLSLAEIVESFERIRRNGQMRGRDPQRVWLISSFVSNCRDVGAEPVIYCAP